MSQKLVTKVNICCLKRIGRSSKRNSLHSLQDKNEVTVGRSMDVDICLPSSMISRNHAVLRKEESGIWTVQDLKSMNGVYVNGVKLKPQVAHPLADGDEVQFGVPVKPGEPAEFVYQFRKDLRVKKIQTMEKDTTSSQGQENDSPVLRDTNRKREDDENRMPPGGGEGTQYRPALKRVRSCMPEPKWSPSADIQKKLDEQERLAQTRLQEQEALLAQMKEQLEEKEMAQAAMLEELKERERHLQENLRKQQEELEKQRKAYEEEMKKTYERQIQEKELSMLQELSQTRKDLIQERLQVEEKLKEEMSRKLEEKDKHLESQLLSQKEKLDKIIEQKELKQKMLETQLNETKGSGEEATSNLKIKEDVLQNFANLMEAELQCTICSELFIQATSLACSHSFCSLCIEQWMAVKKECPNCRTPIASKPVRSIVLDSYIDKMVEHLSEEMKSKRKQLVEERKAEEAKKAAATQAASASTSGRGHRGRGRGRRGRRGGRNARTAAEAPEPVNPSTSSGPPGVMTRRAAAVLISSDSDTDDSDDSSPSMSESITDSSDYDEGIGGAYYGGYGHCFRCGRRGHWANGCPY